MPKGPNGEKRKADVIGNAVHVMRIATGEMDEEGGAKSGRTRSGKAGGIARSLNLSQNEKAEISRNAAKARWTK